MTVYTMYAQVIKIEERFTRLWRSGVGADAKFEEASQGWFIHMRGSHESIFLGAEKPPIEAGDTIKITIQKVEGPNERP